LRLGFSTHAATDFRPQSHLGCGRVPPFCCLSLLVSPISLPSPTKPACCSLTCFGGCLLQLCAACHTLLIHGRQDGTRKIANLLDTRLGDVLARKASLGIARNFPYSVLFPPLLIWPWSQTIRKTPLQGYPGLGNKPPSSTCFTDPPTPYEHMQMAYGLAKLGILSREPRRHGRTIMVLGASLARGKEPTLLETNPAGQPLAFSTFHMAPLIFYFAIAAMPAET